MSQQSDTADDVWVRLRGAPFPLACLVRELRVKWGAEHGVPSVHGFVREVATCLLHRDDVEVGDLEAGRFVPWQLEPWDADERIDRELMEMSAFLEDETRYIFRKKSPNQTLEATAAELGIMTVTENSTSPASATSPVSGCASAGR
jgi:hypothetical protein